MRHGRLSQARIAALVGVGAIALFRRPGITSTSAVSTPGKAELRDEGVGACRGRPLRSTLNMAARADGIGAGPGQGDEQACPPRFARRWSVGRAAGAGRHRRQPGRERIAADGARLDPAHAFLDDGASLLRPALERLWDAAAAGVVDRLHVHSPDRLARRHACQVLLIEECRRSDVEVVFLDRPIGTSAEDDLLLQVQGMIAEHERAKILERSRHG